MTTELHDLDDPRAVLDAVRARREDEVRAANDVLALVARYCAMHSVDSLDVAAVESTALFGDRGIPLAGEGAPLVGEFAVAELAAVLGLSTESGRRITGDVLELRYRLPQVWARVLDYTLPAHKARMIAQRTRDLPADAATWVDAQVAPTAERYGWGRLGRLVEQAMATYDPEAAAQKAAEKAGRLHVDVDTRPMLTDATGPAAGFAFIEATVDLADAADFDAAIGAIAHDLLDEQSHPSTAGLSVHERRAKAVGILARHYTSGQGGQDGDQSSGTARVLHLYAHVGRADLADTGLVAVDNFGSLIPAEQLAEWATTPGTVVKPVRVIDLNAECARDGYEPSPGQREQVALIGRTCAFPHCTRPAWTCDTDHIKPHALGGESTTANLAPLCRRHHRLKTHASWTYEQVRPGEYLWRSPHGYTFLRHRGGGTTELRPDDADTG